MAAGPTAAIAAAKGAPAAVGAAAAALHEELAATVECSVEPWAGKPLAEVAATIE